MMNKFVSISAVFSLMAGSAFASHISGQSGLGVPTVPGATTTITFDAQPDAVFPSLALSGVAFTGLDGSLRTSNEFPNQYNGRGTSYLDNNEGSTPGLRVDFSAPVNAFAFNWGASDVAWTLSAYNSSNVLLESFVLPVTSASNAGDYVGLADNGIAYATLVSSNQRDWIFVDNFTISAGGTTVPEPASLALLGLGLAGLVAVCAKRK